MDVLIAEVRNRAVLWDKKHPRYKDRVVVDREWDVVSEKMGIPKDDAKKKWRNIRDQFFKEYKKIPRGKLSGCLDCRLIYPGKWQHFGGLVFLTNPALATDTAVKTSPPPVEDFAEEPRGVEVDVQLTEEVHRPPMVCLEAPYVSGGESAAGRRCSLALRRKRPLEKGKTPAKKFASMAEGEEDENSLFLRSLLPFLKRMSPLQQLRTRNKFQNVLIEELQDSGGFTHVKHENIDETNT